MTTSSASLREDTTLVWSWRPKAGLLDPGETLLWSGHPDLPRYAREKCLPWFLFGVILLGLVVLSSMAEGSEGKALGAPAFAAMVMLLSPVWHLVRGPWATYVLTDRRAIIDIAGILPRRIIVAFGEITRIEVHAPNATINDIGNILFKDLDSSGDGYTPPAGFYAVPDVKNVEQIFKRAGEDRQRSMLS